MWAGFGEDCNLCPLGNSRAAQNLGGRGTEGLLSVLPGAWAGTRQASGAGTPGAPPSHVVSPCDPCSMAASG